MKIAAKYNEWKWLDELLTGRTDAHSIKFRAKIQYRLTIEEAKWKEKHPPVATAVAPGDNAKPDDAEKAALFEDSEKP